MTPLSQLVEIEAIKRLKARYFRAIDTQDWPVWRDVFTEDATLQGEFARSLGGFDGQLSPKVVGLDAIIAFVEPLVRNCITVHHGHTAEIDVVSELEAKGIWAMEDIVESHNRLLHGYGHYHETYRKVAGEWRIANLFLSRLKVTVTTTDRLGSVG